MGFRLTYVARAQLEHHFQLCRNDELLLPSLPRTQGNWDFFQGRNVIHSIYQIVDGQLMGISVLASWFRLKYPHLAFGALASSAPILYFDGITPQDGYFSVVTKDFKVITLLLIFSFRCSYGSPKIFRVPNLHIHQMRQSPHQKVGAKRMCYCGNLKTGIQ